MCSYAKLFIAALLQVVPLLCCSAVYLDRTIQREGIAVHVKIEDTKNKFLSKELVAQQPVQINLEAKRLADNQPLDNWSPGAWLDSEISPMSGAVPVCGQRIAGFLSGNFMNRPLLDLTGYFVLTLDEEASVSILDPSVYFANKSSLYSVIKLNKPGFDWVKTSDDTRLFVAIPESREVAVIDLQNQKLIKTLKLKGQPTRLALMPGERLLWVGQTGKAESDNQLSVIDTITTEIVATMALPKGHHEFAFAKRGNRAFVSSRDDASIAMIDSANLKPLKTWRISGLPLAMVVTPQNELWVADAKLGTILRYDSQGEPLGNISLKPGISPMQLSPEQDFVFILNPGEQSLYILDSKNGQLRQTVTVSGRPYDVIFSKDYAYIRTLDTEFSAMISLNELKKNLTITPKQIPIGTSKMAQYANLPLASSMTPSLNLAGAFFALPSERTVYHYMEGMNAPSSGIKTFGHTPLATMVTQRGLLQVAPGRYSTSLRLPSAGRMVLALASENPKFKECISVVVKPDEKPEQQDKVKLEWLNDPVIFKKINEPIELKVRILDNKNLPNKLGITIVPASGGSKAYWPLNADPLQKNVLVAKGMLSEPGGFYLHIVGDLEANSNFATLIVDNP